MAYKVNYGLKRAERNRAKQAKKESKLREREAQTAERKSAKEEHRETAEPPAEDGSASS